MRGWLRVRPLVTSEQQFGHRVTTFRDGVWTDEKDKYLRIIDGAFDLLVIARASGKIVAIEKDLVSVAS